MDLENVSNIKTLLISSFRARIHWKLPKDDGKHSVVLFTYFTVGLPRAKIVVDSLRK